MVKIPTSMYTPTIDSQQSTESVQNSIAQGEVTAKAAMLDTKIRAADQSVNRAARDSALAAESAHTSRVGLSNLYYNVQNKYLQTMNVLSEIDQENQRKISSSLAASYNLKANEAIKLNTNQFYADLKSKATIETDILGETQTFLNDQIEKAVASAPNDEAVMNIYKDSSAFKISILSDAIKDKHQIRQDLLVSSLSDQANIAAANLKFNPTQENYNNTLKTALSQVEILRGIGLSEEQTNKSINRLTQDLTKNYIEGLVFAGNIDGAKNALLNENIQVNIGKEFDNMFKLVYQQSEEQIRAAYRKENKDNLSFTYDKGGAIAGQPDAEQVVYEKNLELFQQVEGALQDQGIGNGSTALFDYFKTRNGYMSNKTVSYMANKIKFSNNPDEVALYAVAASKMLNNVDTAKLLINTSFEDNVTAARIAKLIESNVRPADAVKIVRELDNKISSDLGKTRAQELSELHKESTALDYGYEVVGELDNNVFWEPDGYIGEVFGNTPKEDLIATLGSQYKELFDTTYIRTGDAELAKTLSMNLLKAENFVTKINGRPQIMSNSPEKLGLTSTEEGKLHVAEVLRLSKERIAAKLPDVSVGIDSVPFITGSEQGETVIYKAVNNITGEHITIDGVQQYIEFNKKYISDEVKKNMKLRREEYSKAIDLNRKTMEQVYESKIKRTTLIGK